MVYSVFARHNTLNVPRLAALQQWRGDAKCHNRLRNVGRGSDPTGVVVTSATPRDRSERGGEHTPAASVGHSGTFRIYPILPPRPSRQLNRSHQAEQFQRPTDRDTAPDLCQLTVGLASLLHAAYIYPS